MRIAAAAVVITALLFAATAHASTIHVDWTGGADYTAIGVDVGSLGEGCADCDTPVAVTTWGAIKALYR